MVKVQVQVMLVDKGFILSYMNDNFSMASNQNVAIDIKDVYSVFTLATKK